MSTKKSGTAELPRIEESLFSRIIVAPVLFVSFIFSLFLIDRKTYGGIFGQHADKDGYYHSHQRKLAKREMDDAFMMRNKVIAVMAVSSAVGLAVLGWGVSKAYHFMMAS
jgi:hypothetical protein